MNSKQQLRKEIGSIISIDGVNYSEIKVDRVLALVEQAEAALLKAVGEKVIGEDEEGPIRISALPGLKLDDYKTFMRNELRAEQRKALAKLQEGEK